VEGGAKGAIAHGDLLAAAVVVWPCPFDDGQDEVDAVGTAEQGCRILAAHGDSFGLQPNLLRLAHARTAVLDG